MKAESSLLTIFTLVGWLGCVVVGVLGFALPYAKPELSTPPPPPMEVEVLEAALREDSIMPVEDRAPEVVLSEPPLLVEPIALPQAPALIAVAQPDLAIAFPLPVDGPVPIVEAKAANAVRPAEPVRETLLPPLQQLTYGQGQGRQPAPEYPRQSVRQGQEGTITIRFSVGENGQVLAAEAVLPSVWPLLNDAALRAVRQRWRFEPGPVRLYEVLIRFNLQK